MANTVVSYLHPHMETRINDNSTVVEVQASTGTVTFMPYFSSRGVDGVIEEYTSYSQFIADHGTPSFKKHGQAIYNLLQFLRGGGTVYALRLMPEDAKAASASVEAKMVVKYTFEKISDDDGGNTLKVTKVEGGTALTSLTKDKEFADKAAVAAIDVFDEEELKKLDTLSDSVKSVVLTEKVARDLITPADTPLLKIECKGRGKYGDKISVKLAYNQSLTNGYGFAVYELTVIEGGNVIEGPYYVALQPEATNLAGASMYVKNVIEQYSKTIVASVNEDQYDEVIEELAGDQTDEKIAAANKANILGLASQDLTLAGGDDGDAVVEKGVITEIGTALLSAAYGDKRITSKKQFPIDVLFDAAFPNGVKDAIHGLASERGDVFAYLDLGNAVSSANEAKDVKYDANDRCVAVYGQTFTVTDSFTNCDIPVSMTYFLASKVPANDNQYGIQYPLAGPNRGVISGFKSMSFNPTTSEKEDLYKARINYAEQDYRVTKLMTQLTSQSLTSALSNINNMRVLLKMVRTIEEISEGYFFEFASSSVLSHFEQAINSYLSEWVNNGACTVCQGTVYQNDYDVVQRVVRVSIEVVFTGIIERIVIEFNVGSEAN